MKGNDRIGLMKLFLAFFTKALQKHYKALPTDGPTDQRTDTPSYRDGWNHLKRYRKKGEKREKQGPAGQRCVRMALKRHKGIKKA